MQGFGTKCFVRQIIIAYFIRMNDMTCCLVFPGSFSAYFSYRVFLVVPRCGFVAGVAFRFQRRGFRNAGFLVGYCGDLCGYFP